MLNTTHLSSSLGLLANSVEFVDVLELVGVVDFVAVARPGPTRPQLSLDCLEFIFTCKTQRIPTLWPKLSRAKVTSLSLVVARNCYRT